MQEWIQKIKLKIKQYFCDHSVANTIYIWEGEGIVRAETKCDICGKPIPHPMPEIEAGNIRRISKDLKKVYEKIGKF